MLRRACVQRLCCSRRVDKAGPAISGPWNEIPGCRTTSHNARLKRRARLDPAELGADASNLWVIPRPIAGIRPIRRVQRRSFTATSPAPLLAHHRDWAPPHGDGEAVSALFSERLDEIHACR